MTTLASIHADYINKLLSQVTGMKSLVLDSDTSVQVGLIISQSEILARNVYHIQQLHQLIANQHQAEPMHHLKAVVVTKPTDHNIALLCQLLQTNYYTEYYICFTNIVSDVHLQQLANVDAERTVVVAVQEMYLDYYTVSGLNTNTAGGQLLNDVTNNCFHCNAYGSIQLTAKDTHQWIAHDRQLYESNVNTLLAVMLALKRRCDIRFSSGSDLCRMMANDLERRISLEHELFTFNQRDADATPLLLLLDRRDDPVTPLLHQWTYAAMIHELIGIHHSRVTLPQAPEMSSSAEAQHDVLLQPRFDHFYAQSQYLNFGDLGAAIKHMVQEYGTTRKSKTGKDSMQSVEDLIHVVESLPELRAASSNVNKHVSLMVELTKQVNEHNLMQISECEQDIVCNSAADATLTQNIETLVRDPRTIFTDKVRLVALYALHYEQQHQPQVSKYMRMLRDLANTPLDIRQVSYVEQLLNYSRANVRSSKDLFAPPPAGLLSRAANILYTGGGVNGAENVYTRHKPYLHTILTQLQQNKLRTSDYPSVDSSNSNRQYRTVIVYIAGGYTYEELTYVQQWNMSTPSMRIMLGGSCIHNADTFLRDVAGYYASASATKAGAYMNGNSTNGSNGDHHVINMRT